MADVKIQPLGSRVLIRPQEGESITSSGIYIPETAKEKPQKGEVIAIGDDEEIKVKPGQKVMFPKYTGTEIKIDGVEHIIMDADDLLAILKD
ncbi:MAG: co-chaperone GroES [Chloroflexota bacterium]|jgi:chaperonin GroES